MSAATLCRFVVFVAAAAWAQAASAASVAVLPLAGGVDAATRAAWTAALRDAVGGVEGYTALPAATVSEAFVTAEALGDGCVAVETGCIARIGALATANLAVGGRVDATHGGVAVVVELVDVARARAVRRVVFPTGTVPDDAALRLLAVRLLAPGLERAYVTVRGALPGASVSVDGEVRAVAPLAGPIEVRPGRHDVVVDHIDHDTVTHTVDVALGETVVVDVAVASDAVPRPSFDRQQEPEGSPAAAPVRRALRVHIKRVALGDGLPESTGRLFAERVREVLRRVDGVVVVRDRAGIAPRIDPGIDPGFIAGTAVAPTTDDAVAPELDEQAEAVDDAAPGPVDLEIELTIARLEKGVVVSAHGTRMNPVAFRSYQQGVGGSNLDNGLARQAGPLVAAMLRDEAVGPVPMTKTTGLPPWVLPVTIAIGGVGAVASGVTGALWLIDGARSAPLGAACIASVTATGVMAVVAAVEAKYVE